MLVLVCVCVCGICGVFAPTPLPPPFSQFNTTLCLATLSPSASLPEKNASIFCAILQGFPLMTPGTACAYPLFTIPPSHPLPIVKRGETGREWGEQQENSGWDSAASSVVARAERMACCVGPRRYCVSGPFSPSVFCPFFHEYHPSILAIPERNLFIWKKGADKKNVSCRGVVENLLQKTENSFYSPLRRSVLIWSKLGCKFDPILIKTVIFVLS